VRYPAQLEQRRHWAGSADEGAATTLPADRRSLPRRQSRKTEQTCSGIAPVARTASFHALALRRRPPGSLPSALMPRSTELRIVWAIDASATRTSAGL
jgi:hypothetical protein